MTTISDLTPRQAWHFPWCDPSRCGPKVHRSAPITFGIYSGYLFQTETRGSMQHFVVADYSCLVSDLHTLVAEIVDRNARVYQPALVAAACLAPDDDRLPKEES